MKVNHLWVIEIRPFPSDPWIPLIQFCYNPNALPREYRPGIYHSRQAARLAVKSFYDHHRRGIEYRIRKYEAKP